MLFTMPLNKWLLSNQFPIDWRLLENGASTKSRNILFSYIFLSVIRLIMLGFPIELSIYLALCQELYLSGSSTVVNVI